MSKIQLENISVCFKVGHGFLGNLLSSKLSVGGRYDKNAGKIFALQDVSVDISVGERVGLIGHNGAGKSTLLRTMAGIYTPYTGKVYTEGTISALFQSSPGFEPNDTGYQNILNCGLFLGMSKREIIAKRDSIAEFAELGDFLGLPVRTYSAGMQMRLSFAIATAIDPQILLVDEALGTGDAHFAKKAQKRVLELAERSSILVMASHSPGLLSSICNRAIYMDSGRVIVDGDVADVLKVYHSHVAEMAKSGDSESQLKLLRVTSDSIQYGQKVSAEVEIESLLIAIKIDPGNPNKLQRVCALLRQQGKPIPIELEIETLQAVLSIRPDEVSSRQRLAELYAIADSASKMTLKI